MTFPIRVSPVGNFATFTQALAVEPTLVESGESQLPQVSDRLGRRVSGSGADQSMPLKVLV
jgi:hypothetical protein